jgi:hypothetical protein
MMTTPAKVPAAMTMMTTMKIMVPETARKIGTIIQA